jgi:hypothetical protein
MDGSISRLLLRSDPDISLALFSLFGTIILWPISTIQSEDVGAVWTFYAAAQVHHDLDLEPQESIHNRVVACFFLWSRSGSFLPLNLKRKLISSSSGVPIVTHPASAH